MDISVFTDKAKVPSASDLIRSLGPSHKQWLALRDFVIKKYPAAIEEWNYSGVKYGWNFRIKDKKRAIIYFLPRDRYFKVAFVFGQKATDTIMASDISEAIKNELKNAKVYAEGRGIRIDVKKAGDTTDIKKLVEIKLAN